MNPSAPIEQIRQVYELALQHFEAGDRDEAEGICRRAIPQSDEDPNLQCLLAEVLLDQGQPQEARSWFRKTLKRDRDFPRALEGMGLALMAEHKYPQAVDFLKKAAGLVPGRAATHFTLGKALAASGHGVEAEQAFERSFELSPAHGSVARAAEAQRDGKLDLAEKLLRDTLNEHPDNVSALRLLGNIALEAGRVKAALRMLNRAVELAPDFQQAWNDLAGLHMREDQFDKALEKAEHNIALNPRHPQNWVVKGNILFKAARHEESIEAYRKALEINPGQGAALAGMGHTLKTIGRQQEAIDAYRKCIRIHPRLGEAYWSLANLKTFEFEEEEVRLMQRMVQEKNLHDEAKVNIYMALGKHFENEQDYDRAFEHYRTGNDLRRGHETYDPVQTQVVTRRIIDVFTPEFVAQRKGWGEPDPSPILVVGLPRSGSTLIDQILASHSQIEGTMELPDLGRTIREINRRYRPGGKEYPEALELLEAEDAAALGRRYIKSTRRYRSDKPYFIDKMPNNFTNIGYLHLILPNAKIINARRHPLDSCLGCYKQLFYKGQSFTYDQFELAHFYLDYQRIMDHWHAVLPGQVLDVQYEDMVLDQEAQSRRIFEFLGLPWEDQVLRFYETERAINTASSEQVRQPIYTKALNFWKHYEAHLGEMIDILEPLLMDLPPDQRPRSMQ